MTDKPILDILKPASAVTFSFKLTPVEEVERTRATDILVKKANAWLKCHEMASWSMFFEALEVDDDFAEEYVAMLVHTHQTQAALDHRLWAHTCDAMRCVDMAASAGLNMAKQDQRIRKNELSWQALHYSRNAQGKYVAEWAQIDATVGQIDLLRRHYEKKWLQYEKDAHFLWQVVKLLRIALVYL